MTALFHGTVTAAAVLLDPVLVGEAEARRRVIALAGDGFDLLALPGGRWLALLPAPLDLRVERAPGLPLVPVAGGLAAPGLPGRPGTVTWPEAGAVRTADLAALTSVPTRDWVDLSGLPVHRLDRLDAPEPVAVTPAEPDRPRPDLRAAAGLGPAPARLRRLSRSRSSRAAPSARYRTTLVVVLWLLLAAMLADLPDTSSRVTWAVLLTAFAAGLFRRSRALAEGGVRSGRSPRPGAVRRWLARRVTGAAPGVLSARHQRYLRSLTATFERRDWDRALRAAVGLTGEPGAIGWLRLRLPRPRRELRLRLGPESGAAIPMHETAVAHLRALYRRAAAELAAAGRVDQAVFVHAELLGDVEGAVTLLERQGRLRQAAELAEARDQPAALTVRLWWRAGERDRALAVARARGAFAAAVDRLAAVHPAAALDLRRAWAAACRDSGDPLGAVAASWPAPELRESVRADLMAAVAVGGAAAGTALAHLTALDPAAVGPAVELLGRRDEGSLRARAALLAALPDLPGPDPSGDRQLCSAAVRAAYRLPTSHRLRAQVRTLSRRADPLLAADLPPVAGPDRSGTVDLTAPEQPGQLPVRDAVALPDRSVLVACGDLGVRVLSADGRIRARWDVPADQVVPADGGAAALLVRRAGELCAFNLLDLRTRRVRTGPVLRVRHVLPSYDGGTVVTVDEDGIALVDVLAARPRVLWRELDRTYRVLLLNRTPGRLTGLVEAPAGQPVQLWSWELPSMTLRVRRIIEPDPDIRESALYGATLVALSGAEGEDLRLTSVTGYGPPVVTPAAPDTVLRAGGAALAMVRRRRDGRWWCTVDMPERPAAVEAVFPGRAGRVEVREHAGIVTLHDDEGRILAADPGGAGGLAAFATVL